MIRLACLLGSLLLSACRSVPARAVTAGEGATARSERPAATPVGDTADGWRPSRSMPGLAFHDSLGDPRGPGPYRYRLRASAGAAAGVHRHTGAMRIRVVRGRKFLLMGNPPEAQTVRVVAGGETVVIPAGMWHVEWWEEDTVEEISGEGPLRTDHPPAAVPARP